MTIHYVDSNAVGLNDGTSWADAFTVLGLADNIAIADDKIYAASDHSESATGTLVFTLAVPVEVISVNKTTGAYEKGATISANAGSYDIKFVGANGRYMGINFFIGDDYFCDTSSSLDFVDCNFQSHSTNALFTVAALNGSSRFYDCLIDFPNTTSRMLIVKDTGSVYFYRTKFITPGTFLNIEGGMNSVYFHYCDLSEVFGTSYLINPTTMDRKIVTFNRCVMPPNINNWYLAALSSSINTTIDIISCTNMDFSGAGGDDNAYWFEAHVDNNRVISSSTIAYLNSTYDGVNGFSLMFDTDSLTNKTYPLRHKLIELSAMDLTTPKSFKINLLTDGITLTDSELWIEAIYPDNNKLALGLSESTRNSDFLASGVALAINSETWVETLGAPVKQELTITLPILSNASNSNVELWVNVSRPNTTVWVDPLVIES